jgi:hypothetical protein
MVFGILLAGLAGGIIGGAINKGGNGIESVCELKNYRFNPDQPGDINKFAEDIVSGLRNIDSQNQVICLKQIIESIDKCSWKPLINAKTKEGFHILHKLMFKLNDIVKEVKEDIEDDKYDSIDQLFDILDLYNTIRNKAYKCLMVCDKYKRHENEEFIYHEIFPIIDSNDDGLTTQGIFKNNLDVFEDLQLKIQNLIDNDTINKDELVGRYIQRLLQLVHDDMINGIDRFENRINII